MLTLIKDFIVKKNIDLAEEDKDEDDDYSEEFLVDFEFINWIAKLAFSNTNMNAYWKISHLRCYLVALLLREGFDNLKTPDMDEINMEAKKAFERF